MFLKK